MNARMDPSAKYAGLATVIAGCTILALAAGLRQTSGVFLQPVTMDLNLSRQSFGLAVAKISFGAFRSRLLAISRIDTARNRSLSFAA
jgi:hypothetical protein